MLLPSRMPMAVHTTSSTIRSTTTNGAASTWREITPLRSPTISSTKTVRPPDPPAVDLALKERAPAALNLQGSSCTTTWSVATRLAKSMSRFSTLQIPGISHRLDSAAASATSPVHVSNNTRNPDAEEKACEHIDHLLTKANGQCVVKVARVFRAIGDLRSKTLRC